MTRGVGYRDPSLLPSGSCTAAAGMGPCGSRKAGPLCCSLRSFSTVHSQESVFVLHFLGLTESEIQSCIRTETKERVLFFFTKTSVQYKCTTNKMSEKYEGNILSLLQLPLRILRLTII